MKCLSIALLSSLLFTLPVTSSALLKDPQEIPEDAEKVVEVLTDEEEEQLQSIDQQLESLEDLTERLEILKHQIDEMFGTESTDSPPMAFEPEPFLVEINLNEYDKGEQNLLLHTHFPPTEDGYLDQVNGWYIYQADDPSVPEGPDYSRQQPLADLRLIFAPADNPEPVINLHLESVPSGAWSFFEFMNPRRTASQIIPIQVTEQGVMAAASTRPEILRESTQIRQATYGLPARLAIKLRPAKESRQIQNAANSSPSKMNEPKMDFFRTPKHWLEVSVVNEAGDMRDGASGFTIGCARHWPGYLADASNPSINEARYDAHFNLDLSSDASNSYRCELHPVTLVRSNQQQWQSLIGDGEITLVIRQLQPTTTRSDTGAAYSSTPPVIGARFIKISLRDGNPKIVGGNYQMYVKRIVLKYAKDMSPASVTLVMHSQKEMEQQLLTGYEVPTEIVTVNAQPEMPEDMTDGASNFVANQQVPLWLMDFGFQAASTQMFEIPMEVASPIATDWLF